MIGSLSKEVIAVAIHKADSACVICMITLPFLCFVPVRTKLMICAPFAIQPLDSEYGIASRQNSFLEKKGAKK